MPLGYFFWAGMLLWLILGLYGHRVEIRGGDYAPIGGSLLLFLLLFALGTRVFGWFVK